MATDLPYPLPNPRPCGCNGAVARAYGEADSAGGGSRGIVRGLLAVGGIAAMLVVMSLVVPPAKEKPTVFLPPPKRRPYLPE